MMNKPNTRTGTANCLTVSPEEAALLRQNKLAFVMSGRHVYWVAHFDTPQGQTTCLPGSGLQVVGWAHEDGPNQGRIIYLLARSAEVESMNDKNQPPNLNKDWLLEQGYTIRQAAKAIGRSHAHVAFVLNGKRSSGKTERLLRALPKRPLRLRERVAAR